VPRASTPRPPLSREHVIEAALAVADERGLTAVSMRNVAERLGLEAMSLYPAVLRRANVCGVASGGRRSTRSRATTTTKPASTRSRISADEVRAAIPDESFTVKDLQQRSSASAVVVRRVINEQVDAGRLTDQGADPDHTGRGRAPTIYQP